MYTCCNNVEIHTCMHVLMRDEKEGRKKQATCTCLMRDAEGRKKEASKDKKQATRQSNTAHPMYMIIGLDN